MSFWEKIIINGNCFLNSIGYKCQSQPYTTSFILKNRSVTKSPKKQNINIQIGSPTMADKDLIDWPIFELEIPISSVTKLTQIVNDKQLVHKNSGARKNSAKSRQNLNKIEKRFFYFFFILINSNAFNSKPNLTVLFPHGISQFHRILISI